MMILGENVNTLKVIDSSLRLIVIPLSIASLWLTLTNYQENDTYGKLEFNNLKGLKFFVSISAISAGYALIAVVSSWVKNLMNKAWIFFVCDQVIYLLLIFMCFS
ncbi:putative casparian strip membrane protein [Helianthus anomalus]